MALIKMIPVGNGGGRSIKYSTDEQIIGEWIDGKPIYQKVIPNLDLAFTWDGQYNTKTSSVDITSYASNIDIIINSVGIVNNKSYPVIIDGTTNAYIKSFVGGTLTMLILQYTKTTE